MFASQHHDPGRSEGTGVKGDIPQAPPGAGQVERDLIAGQLQQLYDSNRGALYANALIEAQEAFKHGDFVKTLELVQASRGLYEQRHRKTLEKDPARPDGKKKASRKERLALEHKQGKIQKTLGTFEAVAQPLEKMARLQRLGRQPAKTEGARPSGDRSAEVLPPGFPAEYQAAETAGDQYQIVCRHFDVWPVGSDQDIAPGGLYFVRGKESHLIRISHVESPHGCLAITAVLSEQRIKPVPTEKMLELGRKGLVFRLLTKSTAGVHTPATTTGPQKSHADVVVDMGSFTQLLTVAQQSGIVPGADQIAQVRDREFRMGNYRTAFEIIERMSTKFNQTALDRQQKLRNEEMDYKSGVLKMSPKQWQQKQQRDILQTNNIQRARRHFSRVLDGLRILITAK